MKKVAKKITTTKSTPITGTQLDKVLDKRFKEYSDLMLEAVNTIVRDSEKTVLGYIELRTQEILDVFKDDRVENNRSFTEHDLRISSLEKKTATLTTT